MKKATDTVKFERSSGNVFADIGLPNPQTLLAKAQLAHQIYRVIKRRRLTQKEAARILGLDQPKISALVRGRLEGFSTDRLLKLLLKLGQEIEIVIRPNRQTSGQGHINVTVSSSKSGH